MIDSRKEFENWYSGAFITKPKFTMVSPNHYKDDDVDAAYWSWKACQKVNDARITSLESQLASALAANQVMRDALQVFAKCVEQIDSEEDDEEYAKFRLLIKNYRHAQSALAIKPGDIALVEVGNVCFEDTLVGVDLTNANIKHGDKVYALQKKEG